MRRDPWPITVDFLDDGLCVSATCTPGHDAGHPNHPDNIAPECVLSVFSLDEKDVTDDLYWRDYNAIVKQALKLAAEKAEEMEADHA